MPPASREHPDPNVLAVIHRFGRTERALVVRRPGNGAAAGQSDAAAGPTVVAWREFSGRADSAELRQWLDEQHVGECVRVLPCSKVICRTFTLPDAPDEHIIPALRLQAESHLLGIAPPHRMGMSVIEQAQGETSRIGLVLAWPERAGESNEPAAPVDAEQSAAPAGENENDGGDYDAATIPTTYAPDIAALAALLNGYRPTQPVLWLDRADGSCAMAMTHANGAVFRGIREDEDDPGEWKKRVGQALAETALNVGHTSSFIEATVKFAHERIDQLAADEARLFAPQEIISAAAGRLTNAPKEAEWWDRFGIAAGVALARAGSLRDLTMLVADEPIAEPSPWRTAMERLSRPSTAMIAVIACIALLMFGPLIFSSLRLGLLKIQHARMEDRLEEIENVRQKLIVYSQLDRDHWPMAKVLADIASCTPEGIELETLFVRSNRNFTLNGRAIPTNDLSAPQVVETMRDQLRTSGIFSDITLNWGQGDAYGNYEFGLTARLRQPFRRHAYPEQQDWARWTLAHRREGIKPGTPLDEVVDPYASADGQPPREQPPSLVQGGERGGEGPGLEEPPAGRQSSPFVRPPSPVVPPQGGDPGGAQSPRERGGAGTRPSDDIPPPLTEDEINRMSESEVRDTLIRVAEARRNARRGDDEELKARLQREFELLMARMGEFQ